MRSACAPTARAHVHARRPSSRSTDPCSVRAAPPRSATRAANGGSRTTRGNRRARTTGVVANGASTCSRCASANALRSPLDQVRADVFVDPIFEGVAVQAVVEPGQLNADAVGVPSLRAGPVAPLVQRGRVEVVGAAERGAD